MINSIKNYLLLMRADRPIGTFLLLWPSLTALTIAGNGKIEIYLLIVFCISD